MKTLFLMLGALVLVAGFFWLRAFPFREKKSKAPVKTGKATLTGRRVVTGVNRTGRSSGMGYNYVLTFRLESGETVDVYAHDTQWGALREGMTGTLTWQEPYFVGFEQGK